MDIQKLLSQFVASLLQSAGFGGESSTKTEKTGVEIRREFQSRIDRGDKISNEELLAVPLHHVPAKLTDQWLEAKNNANQPAKSPIAERWSREFSGQPERSLADDLATINEATPQAVAVANEQNRTSFQTPEPSQPAMVKPPATPPGPAGDKRPNFYHQRDPNGNTMAELLTARDGSKADRGGRSKAEVKRQIKAWANHFDAQQKGPSQRPDYNSPGGAEVAPATPATSPATQSPATPSVRDQWIQSQQPNADGTPAQPGTAGNRAELVHAITEGQDNASEGQPGPKQPQTSTPLPDDVVEANTNGSPASEEPSGQSVKADSLQLGLDAVGTFGDAVVPGLGVVADGANAAISVGRMFTDPARAGEHAQNAAISTVSMVPFVGDLAKVFKGKRTGKTIGRASNMMKGSAIGGAVASAMAAGRKPRRETDGQRADNLHGMPDDAGQRESIKPDNGGGESSEQAGRPSPMPAPGGGNLGGHADNFAQEQKEQEQAGKKSRLYAGLDGSLKGLTITAGALAVAFTGGAAAIAGFVGSKAWKLMERLETNNDRILGQNTGLAQYNGKLAESYAVSEAASIERGRNKADAVAGPVSWLNEEQSEMKASMDEIRNPIEAMNAQLVAFQSAVVNKVNDVLGVTELVGNVLESIASMIGVEVGKGEATDTQAFFQDLSDGKFDGYRPDFYEGGRDRILKDQKDHDEVFRR